MSGDPEKERIECQLDKQSRGVETHERIDSVWYGVGSDTGRDNTADRDQPKNKPG